MKISDEAREVLFRRGRLMASPASVDVAGIDPDHVAELVSAKMALAGRPSNGRLLALTKRGVAQVRKLRDKRFGFQTEETES